MMFNLKYRSISYFCLLIAIIVLSCGKESSCIKSTGKAIKEERNISVNVNTIIIDDKIDLVLTQSNEARLSIEGGKNLLPYINTEVSGNELKISSDNKCNFLRDYGKRITAYLSLPNIIKINYTGQGNISSTNTLNLSNFDFETRNGTGSINLNIIASSVSVFQHTGPSDITISGSSNNLYAYSGENGWIYLNNLVANNVHVNNAGTGDISVTANNSLLVELTSIGNIDYYGNPLVIVSVHTGTGQVRKQ